MKSKKPFAILIAFVIVVQAVFFISKAVNKQENKLKDLEQEIEFLKEEQVPIRYKIISQKENEIEVSVKFYDLDGNEINKQRFTLEGTVASFDFYVVKMTNKYIAFPSKLFSDKIKPQDAISLFEYYEKSNFPMIFNSKNSSDLFKIGIENLFAQIKSGNLEEIENVFGNMVQNALQTMQNGVEGNVYKIVVHTKGGIEIIQE